nr:unnamed protein product [Callosobruchus chinensis]
MCELWWGSSGK